MGFFRDLLHVARMIREERQDGARLFGAAEHFGKQLKIQLDMAKERAGGRWLPHTSGALGYCYGWCDEGLKTCGFDINQRRTIGAPVLLKVFGTLWPGDQQGCTVYIFEHLGHVFGWQVLGQTEFLEWDQQKLEMPTGLIRCLRGEPPWIVRGFSK